MQHNPDDLGRPPVTDGAVRRTAFAIIALSTCVTIAAVAILIVPDLRADATRLLTTHPGYSPGMLLDLPADLYSRNVRTVVVIVRQDCLPCEAARPFLARLLSDGARQ